MATGKKRAARHTNGAGADAKRTASRSQHPVGQESPPGRKRPSQAQDGATVQEKGFATVLGYFSVGLGLMEVLFPRRVAKLVGIPRGYANVIRTMGAREIASGVGILTQRAPSAAIWSRVGGDVVDLAGLGAAFFSPSSKPTKLAAACVAVGGVTVLDVLCAQKMSQMPPPNGAAVEVSVAIGRSPEELYQFWRDFENLPRFMKHLKSVNRIGNGRSHWIARGPAGTTIAWDAEITEDRANQAISWRSLEGSDVRHAGSIHFQAAPGARGTLVTVKMDYHPPAGALGSTIAWLFGEDPRQTVKADLRRFKQLMETGEVITTEGQPAGRHRSTSWKYDQATTVK